MKELTELFEENLPSSSHIEKEAARLNRIITNRYLGFDDPLTESRLNSACSILYDSIVDSLLAIKNFDKTYREIAELLQASDVSKHIAIEKAYREAEIRRDFASALRSVRRGGQLAEALRYAFSGTDLYNLAKLHKKNKFRKKIENLLDDCNFRKESALMHDGDYSQWLSDDEVNEK